MYSPAPRNPDALRQSFSTNGLETASSQQIIAMCYDRLDRDLAEALDAIEGARHYDCNRALGHAQDLISEMATMLDLAAWEHAGSLMAVYDYLLRLLAVANAEKAASLVREAQQLVFELGEAFRTAAAEATTIATATSSDAISQSADETMSRISVQA